MLIERECLYCFAPIVGGSPLRKFCSDACRYRARPIAPCRLGSCAQCGCDIQLDERSKDSASCLACRRKRPRDHPRGCECGPCRQVHRDYVKASNLKYREAHGESRSTTYRRINGWPGRDGGHFEISTERRRGLYERDNWTCAICHEPTSRVYTATNPWSPTLDHIEPQSRALIPDHSDANLRTAHALCNAMRGAGTTSDREIESRVKDGLYQAMGIVTPPLP